MEPYLEAKLVIIFACAFWLISTTSVYLFYLVVLHLGYDFTENAHQLWQLRYLGLGITSASLLVSFLAAWLLSRWLRYPFVKLPEAAKKVQAGEFNTLIEIDCQERLELLVETFNSMVTAVRKQTQAIVTQNEICQQNNELKDENLVNGVQAELQRLLDEIMVIAQSLLEGAYGQLSKTQKKHIAVIEKSSRHLLGFSKELLDFQINQYDKLEIKPTDLWIITNNVVGSFSNLFEDAKIQVLNGITSDVPPVEADAKLLQKILHNLIDRAIKLNAPGIVKVSAEVVSYQLEVNVAALSATMQIEQLDEMFSEPTDNLIAQKFNCTDLDLVTTKQLIEVQGGKLYCSSTVEQTPQFTFTLPIAQNVPLANSPSLPRTAQTKIVTTSRTSTNSTGQFTIMVVDDDKISLQVLTKLLTLQNYQVVQATNGMQALDKIEQGLEPDLIILDIMMPRINGYEVCQKVRESFSANQLPIIMLTAKEQPSDLVEGLSYGANDYLVKPINRSELVARVKAHIQLAKVNTAYSRFVPNEFIRLLGHESILDVKLGDHVKREMAILFSDIRSFTTLSEQMSPEENFDFINSYLKMVVPAIRNHQGFIDKYIGDAVMAVFPQQAEDALRAAIAMQKQVLRYNCDRVANGEVPIAIGTGIHVGSLMLGTVGEEQRMEETVISDAVNVASRLEGLTKIFGSTVIFSEKILIELEDPTQYKYRFLGKVPVKGRKDAISVFEAFDGEAPELIEVKVKTRVDFELGISFYYDRKFVEGSEMFERVLKKNSADKAALLYLERCQKFRK